MNMVTKEEGWLLWKIECFGIIVNYVALLRIEVRIINFVKKCVKTKNMRFCSVTIGNCLGWLP
jgi:hypothetical protein